MENWLLRGHYETLPSGRTSCSCVVHVRACEGSMEAAFPHLASAPKERSCILKLIWPFWGWKMGKRNWLLQSQWGNAEYSRYRVFWLPRDLGKIVIISLNCHKAISTVWDIECRTGNGIMPCSPVQPVQPIFHFLCDILCPHTVYLFLIKSSLLCHVFGPRSSIVFK